MKWKFDFWKYNRGFYASFRHLQLSSLKCRHRLLVKVLQIWSSEAPMTSQIGNLSLLTWNPSSSCWWFFWIFQICHQATCLPTLDSTEFSAKIIRLGVYKIANKVSKNANVNNFCNKKQAFCSDIVFNKWKFLNRNISFFQ